MSHIDRAKLDKWRKQKLQVCADHGDISGSEILTMLRIAMEEGYLDLTPTDVCPTCGGSGFSGLAALAGNGYDAVCDNCGGGGEIPKQSHTDVDVKEIEEGLSKITSGNWHVQPGEYYDAVYSSQETILRVVASKTITDDAYFIANAPTWLRLLLTKYTETLAQVERWEKEARLQYRLHNEMIEQARDYREKLSQAVEALEKISYGKHGIEVFDYMGQGREVADGYEFIADEALQSIKGENTNVETTP